MTVSSRFLPCLAGVLALCAAATAHAQSAATTQQGDNYSAGKSAEQLFKSDCSGCHKTAQGLVKASAGLGFGVDGFLRKHYTTSRETAALLADYLVANAGAGESKPAPTARGKKTPATAAAPPAKPAPSFFSIFTTSKPDEDSAGKKEEKPRRAAKPAADKKKKPADDGGKPAADPGASSNGKPSQPDNAKPAAKPSDTRDDGKAAGGTAASDNPETNKQAAGKPAGTKAGQGDNPPAIAAPEKKAE